MSVLVPSGPDKTSSLGEDVLSQLLDEDLESDVMLAQRLSSSPPHHLPHTHSLTPLRKTTRAPGAKDAPPPKSADILGKRRLSETSSPPPDDPIRSDSFTAVLGAGFCGSWFVRSGFWTGTRCCQLAASSRISSVHVWSC